MDSDSEELSRSSGDSEIDSISNSEDECEDDDDYGCPATKDESFRDHPMVEYHLDSREPRQFCGSELSDLCLVAGGVEFNVHKLFLSAYSSYFKKLLAPELQKTDKKRIEIDADPTYLNAVLEVVYKGKQADLRYLRLKCNEERSARAFWTHLEGLWKVIDGFDFHVVREYFRRKIEKYACNGKVKGTWIPFLWTKTALNSWLRECSRFLPDSITVSGKIFQGACRLFKYRKDGRRIVSPSPERPFVPSTRSEDSWDDDCDSGNSVSPKAKKRRVEMDGEAGEEMIIKSKWYLCRELSDVCLVVRGVGFHVHKMLLASHLPYFTDVFFGPSAGRNKKRISIDADPTVFESLMNVVYHKSIKDKDYLRCDDSNFRCLPQAPVFFEKAEAIWALIDRFDLPYVRKYFEHKLFKKGYSENHYVCRICINHTVFAKLHGLDVLKTNYHIASSELEKWLDVESKHVPEEVRVNGPVFQWLLGRVEWNRPTHLPYKICKATDCVSCEGIKAYKQHRGKCASSEAKLLKSRKPHSYREQSDVCLTVGGVEFNVHRMVLAVHSGYFRKMFYPDSIDNGMQRAEIDADPFHFALVMEIVYDGRLSDISFLKRYDWILKVDGRHQFWEKAEGIWQLAERLDIPYAKEWLETKINRFTCDVDNPAFGLVTCIPCFSHYIFDAMHDCQFHNKIPRFRPGDFLEWMKKYSQYVPETVPLSGPVVQKMIHDGIRWEMFSNGLDG